jgi:hypothetical protein
MSETESGKAAAKQVTPAKRNEIRKFVITVKSNKGTIICLNSAISRTVRQIYQRF